MQINLKKIIICLFCLLICVSFVSCKEDTAAGNDNHSVVENSNGGGAAASGGGANVMTKSEGTRKDPVPFGETAVYDGTGEIFYDYKADFTVTEVIRGDEAWKIIEKANQFNDEPESGKEYMLVKFKIKALESTDDKKIDINNANFSFISSSGTTYDDFVVVTGVKPELSGLYAGAENEGYAYQEVAKDDQVLVVLHEGFDSELWFATNK